MIVLEILEKQVGVLCTADIPLMDDFGLQEIA